MEAETLCAGEDLNEVGFAKHVYRAIEVAWELEVELEERAWRLSWYRGGKCCWKYWQEGLGE